MYKCKEVTVEYFAEAPCVYRATVEVNATPEQIFTSFEDAGDWPKWAPPIQLVEWTSPKPFGLGTTRRVSMSGNLIGDETFIAWDYPKRMAFCFTHSSQSLIESFAEDYQLTVLPGGKTQVIWTMAMTPKGIGKISMAIFGPFMGLANQWMFNRFKKHIEKRFPKL
jgi:hypothetical protein